MADEPEKTSKNRTTDLDALKRQIDEYVKQRTTVEEAAAEAELELCRREAAEESQMAEEVENAALEQAQPRTPEELRAYREQLWGPVIAASTAADAADTAPTGRTIRTAGGSTLQVLPGGVTPTATPATPVNVASGVSRLTATAPPVTAPPPLDPAFAKTYPDVEAPQSLFDLQLRPDMYPQDSFFTDYFALFEPTTDAPRSFHLATAISILATAMGPNWIIKHRAKGLRPNMWFMLLADSGTRKSTAMGVARDMFGQSVCWEGSVESTRAWFTAMAEVEDENVLWIFDEAISLFALLEKHATKDLADRLTSAYNGEPLTYHSITAGVIQLQHPHLSILTGTPIHSLRRRGLTADVLQGGIFGRFLLIPGTTTRSLALPPAVYEPGFKELQSTIDTIYKQHRNVQVTLSYEAEQVYCTWYENRGTGGSLAETSTGIWNRAGDHVLKLALIYHVATYRRMDQPVQRDTMEQAIAFLQEYLLPGHLWATRRFMETSPVKKAFMAAEDYAYQPTGVLYTQLPDALGVTLDYLAKILAVLWFAKRIDFWYWREHPGEGFRPKILVSKKGVKPSRIGEVYEMPIEVPRAVRRHLALIGEDKELREIQTQWNVCGTWDPMGEDDD